MIRPEVLRLYKYREFSQRALDMITNDQVYFAAPVTFNDPFDCAIEPVIDDVRTGEEIIELTAARFRLHGVDEEETRNRLKSFHGANSQLVQYICEQIREVDMRERTHGLGVLSLSQIDNHPLLWAHYADSHRGFCIEYQRTLENNLKDAKPITYSENYPRVSLFRMDLYEQSDLAVFTKSTHWEYENEWRRVITEPNVIKTYKSGMITGIIFGAKMNTEHKRAIRSALEGKPQIQYYQANLKNRSYDLYIEAI